MRAEHDRRDVVGRAGGALADQRAEPLRLEVVRERLAGGVRPRPDQRRRRGGAARRAGQRVPAGGSRPCRRRRRRARARGRAASRARPSRCRGRRRRWRAGPSTTAGAPRSVLERRPRGTGRRARAGTGCETRSTPPSPMRSAAIPARSAAASAGSGSGQPRDSVSGTSPPSGTHSTSRWRLKRRASACSSAQTAASTSRPSSPNRAPSAASRAAAPGIRRHQPLEPAGERRAQVVREHPPDASSAHVDHRVDRDRAAGAGDRHRGGGRRAARTRPRPPRRRSAAASRRAPRRARPAASACAAIGAGRKSGSNCVARLGSSVPRIAPTGISPPAAAPRDPAERRAQLVEHGQAAALGRLPAQQRTIAARRRARLTRAKARSASMNPEPVASMYA